MSTQPQRTIWQQNRTENRKQKHQQKIVCKLLQSPFYIRLCMHLCGKSLVKIAVWANYYTVHFVVTAETAHSGSNNDVLKTSLSSIHEPWKRLIVFRSLFCLRAIVPNYIFLVVFFCGSSIFLVIRRRSRRKEDGKRETQIEFLLYFFVSFFPPPTSHSVLLAYQKHSTPNNRNIIIHTAINLVDRAYCTLGSSMLIILDFFLVVSFGSMCLYFYSCDAI